MIDPNIEHVSGIVVGEFTNLASLWYNGREQFGPKYVPVGPGGDAEALEWAKARIVKAKAEMGENEYKRLYPNGLELRIYD